MGKIRYICDHLVSEIDQIRLFKPMQEALSMLSERHIPVFFYNRIGIIKGYDYPVKALERMRRGLSFPRMLRDPDKYENDLRDVFGDKFSRDYIESLGEIPQIIKKTDHYCHEDYSSQYINVVNGQRRTLNHPLCANKRIHMYGRCGVFGYAVEDGDTLPSKLQSILREMGVDDIKVINHGLWGGNDNLIEHNFLEDCLGFGPNDIVVFYIRRFHSFEMNKYLDCGVWYKDFTEKWHSRVKEADCFFDKPGHMNERGYQIVGELIAEDLVNHSFSPKNRERTSFMKDNTSHLMSYIKKSKNIDLLKEIKAYTDGILKEYPIDKEQSKCGAIVMNCNPFTKGHRYLVEYAASRVDRLYLFVVEEDRSQFVFEDRMAMVKQGTCDIKNVVVVPSGEYMISAYTFPEYFLKEYVKEKSFDVSMDVELFGRYIAPSLSIGIRFAGEEPFDPVTSKYNETMSEILPLYGVSFEVVPRMKLNDGKVINATGVRQLLAEKKYDEMKEYIPDTTYDIIMSKYITETDNGTI